MPRDEKQDAAFANSMANGMQMYEASVASRKAALFPELIASLPTQSSPVVVELGVGTFPNAKYWQAARNVDLIGVDPNTSMEPFAREAADRSDLAARGISFRFAPGVGEALPLADASADAVVCTLTLCSVRSPEATLGEVLRVLRPGGRFLFLEHILSDNNEALARTQRALTPLQVATADNCHLDRPTLESIRAAGFASVEAERFELPGFLWLSPTVAGIATK